MFSTNGFKSLFNTIDFDSDQSKVVSLAVDGLTVTTSADLTGATIVGLETGDVSESTNLYYTTSRFDARLADKTTDDLSEGKTNLYFTDTRVSDSADVKSNTTHRTRTDNPHAVSASQIGITSVGSGSIITSGERTAIGNNTSNITTLSGDVLVLSGRIDATEGDIKTNYDQILINIGDISTNKTNIATNVADITTNATDITTNASSISTNATNISTLSSDVKEITYDQTLNTTDSVEFKTVEAVDLTATGNLQAPQITASTSLATDTITEDTVGAGITVDGVLIKDGLVDGVDVSGIVSYPSADATKVGYLTVTAPVDLDSLSAYDQDLNTTDDVSFASVNGFDVSTLSDSPPSTNLVVGTGGASITTGLHNTALGYGSMPNITDVDYCVAVGGTALGGSGGSGTAIGYYAGGSGGTGENNTFVGARAGDNSLGTASGCVALGANTTLLTDSDNQLALGFGATCTAANQCTIGDSKLAVIRPGSDNKCDLGSSSTAFKDFYIDGAIVGTGLFPVQTFTPTAQDSSSRAFTASVANGRYMTIGSMLFVQFNLAWSNKGSASGRIRFSLPVASLAVVPMTFNLGYYYGVTFTDGLIAVGSGGNAYFELFSTVSGSSTTPLTNAEYNAVGQVQVQGFYWV